MSWLTYLLTYLLTYVADDNHNAAVFHCTPASVTSAASRTFTIAASMCVELIASLSVNTRSADSFAIILTWTQICTVCIYLRHLGRFSAITALRFVFYVTGGTEIAGRENDGPSCRTWNCYRNQTMKQNFSLNCRPNFHNDLQEQSETA